jgi:hypothetical protein
MTVQKMNSSLSELDNLCVETIRFLSMEGVQAANSGHPGMPMGMADLGVVLWTQFLRVDPAKMEAVEKWAADEFRSTNGQIEWIIDQALRKSGRWKSKKST